LIDWNLKNELCADFEQSQRKGEELTSVPSNHSNTVAAQGVSASVDVEIPDEIFLSRAVGVVGIRHSAASVTG